MNENSEPLDPSNLPDIDPAGFDLGAETPEEIALAIVSEIHSVFAEASGESLRDRKAAIHGWSLVRTPYAVQVEECVTLAP